MLLFPEFTFRLLEESEVGPLGRECADPAAPWMLVEPEKDWIEMPEYYRFRSTQQLLDEKYKELESQTIYFASPDQLNDPIEGFRDLVFTGDEIVWSNLFKHFVYSFQLAYLMPMVLEDAIDLATEDIPLMRWSLMGSQGHTDDAEFDFSHIWNAARRMSVGELIEKIVETEHNVRYRELLFYLEDVHAAAITAAQEILFEQGGALATNKSTRMELIENWSLIRSKYFGLIQNISNVSSIDASAEILQQFTEELRLTLKYNRRKSPNDLFDRNNQLLSFDFPDLYGKKIWKLLWPEWYAACFTRNYKNSSMWGNYGNQHEGVCLIFEVVEGEKGHTLALDQEMAFHDVNYVDKIGEVDFFRSLGNVSDEALLNLCYADDAGEISRCAAHLRVDSDHGSWRSRYYDSFYHAITTKTRDWEYEEESRLILKAQYERSLCVPCRSQRYDFNSLKGVIFGIRTSDEDKIRIIDILEGKCTESRRSDFKFYQAYYSPQSGEIRKYEMSVPSLALGDLGCGNV